MDAASDFVCLTLCVRLPAMYILRAYNTHPTLDSRFSILDPAVRVHYTAYCTHTNFHMEDSLRVLSLFDGISCGQRALADAQVPVSAYYASEVDPKAIAVTQSNFPETIQLGSVERVKGHDLPTIDLLIAGSPCQGFSQQGNQEGFANKGSGLYSHFLRILQETRPRWFLLENVKMQPVCASRISTDLGVPPLQLNSRYWVPQNRERLYWTNIPCALKLPPDSGPPHLGDLVGKGYEGVYATPHGYFKGGFKERCAVAPCVTRTGWLSSFSLVQGGQRRKFTLEEVERLQGLPAGYTQAGGSNSSRVALLGNAWTVPTVASLLEGVRPANEGALLPCT